MASRAAPNPILREISRADFAPSPSTTDVRQLGLRPLVSYNWTDKAEPTILVPGLPPKWTPPRSSAPLTPDAGLFIIDQNAYRCPQHPLEPLFRALLSFKPTFDVNTIDLVSDRNNLSKLLRFVSNEEDEPFTIGVQRLGTTTLFVRTEPKSSEQITGFRGFGQEFKKAYTTTPAGMEHSTSNHRVVQYGFGGLQCVIRFEVDASTAANPAIDVNDGLASMFNAVSIAPESSGQKKGMVQVIKRGALVPQASVVEIKTRAMSRTLNLQDTLPQMWISGTPALAIAYHQRGRFGAVTPTRLDTGELTGWEQKNARMLRKLVRLIKIIVREAKHVEGGRCVVQGMGDGTLRIKKATGGGECLPQDLKAKFH